VRLAALARLPAEKGVLRQSEPKLVQGIYQDGRGRRAHLLQAGWRQGQI